MSIPLGRRRISGTRITWRGRRPIKKVTANIKSIAIPFKNQTAKPTANTYRGQGKWNAMKIKGSFVWSIEKVALTKAERKKLKKLSPDQRRERRRKIYRKLDAMLDSDNPANLEVGKRVGDLLT